MPPFVVFSLQGAAGLRPPATPRMGRFGPWSAGHRQAGSEREQEPPDLERNTTAGETIPERVPDPPEAEPGTELPSPGVQTEFGAEFHANTSLCRRDADLPRRPMRGVSARGQRAIIRRVTCGRVCRSRRRSRTAAHRAAWRHPPGRSPRLRRPARGRSAGVSPPP